MTDNQHFENERKKAYEKEKKKNPGSRNGGSDNVQFIWFCAESLCEHEFLSDPGDRELIGTGPVSEGSLWNPVSGSGDAGQHRRFCQRGGGQTEDVPDAGSDENVAAFANRTNDDAVLEKTDSEENGEKEDTEGKDAGENSKDKSEGGEGLEKAESGSGEQGDSGKDGNSAENGDSQDENANPGNGESDEKDDSGKTDSGSSGGNADLNENGSSSNGKTDQPKEDVKTDEKTEEEIDEKEGFWRKVKVRWVLDAEESQASRYDGENPGIYLFRAELKSSNYEVDEDELPVIQITVLEEEQAKTTLEFAPLEESITDQILPLGSKESDIQFPETLTVRETRGEETTERTLPGITWKLDAENSDYSEFQGGLAPEDYFDRFDEDGEPEETEEKTWEGYDKANEECKGAIYTYVPVIPESEEIPEDIDLPEIHVQVGDAGCAVCG